MGCSSVRGQSRMSVLLLLSAALVLLPSAGLVLLQLAEPAQQAALQIKRGAVNLTGCCTTDAWSCFDLWLIVSAPQGTAYLGNVCTDAAYRRRGYGAAMLRAAERSPASRTTPASTCTSGAAADGEQTELLHTSYDALLTPLGH